MTPEHKALREAAEEGMRPADTDAEQLEWELRYFSLVMPATILSLLDALAASEARVEKARNDALEEAAKVVDKYPPNILLQYDRPPNGPPGNQMVPTPPHLIAAAIRALTELTKP